MISVIPASKLPQYNTSGELVCNNGGVLFANNLLASNVTICNATAEWTLNDFIDCYSGT